MATRSARRGSFGRLPRSQPSLTATLVSIAQQMENKEDQNIMDAWQKGGTVKGKPVTDQAMLAHWKMRLAQVDKRDPLYDTYKQTIDQMTYSIAESKITVAYAQKRIGEMAVAKFYLDWAKKIPVNSEFYRVLQRDAAQYVQAARARGAAGAKRAQEEAYISGRDAIQQRTGKTADYMTTVLNNIAQAGDLVGSGGNFSQFDPGDTSKILDELSKLSDASDNGTVLYHLDQNGNLSTSGTAGTHAVTIGDVRRQMRKLDTSWNGQFSADQYRDFLARQQAGYKELIANAIKTGHASDAKFYRDASATAAMKAREANLWGPEQAYDHLRKTFESTWLDGSASIQDKLAAQATYNAGLTSLANDASLHLDDNTKSRLLGEANGDAGVTTLAEDLYGFGNPDSTGTKGDSASTAAFSKAYQANVELAQVAPDGTSKGVFTYGQWQTQNGAPVFVPASQLPVGAAAPDIGAIEGAPPVGGVKVYVPSGTIGGPSVAVYAIPQPLTVSVQDNQGKSADPNALGADVIGQTMDISINGVITRLYQYTNQGTQWTAVPPVQSEAAGLNVQQTRGKNGGINFQITYTQDDFSSQAFKDKLTAAGTNGYLGIGLNSDGTKPVFVGQNVAQSTDPTRYLSGKNPYTDSFSPTVAGILSQPNGQQLLAEIGKDPVARNGMIADIYASQGLVLGSDGGYVNPDGSLMTPLQAQVVGTQTNQLNASFTTLPSGSDDSLKLHGASETWDRTHVFAPPVSSSLLPDSAHNNLIPATTPIAASTPKLPADFMYGTPFEKLGSAIYPRTNIIKPPVAGPNDRNVPQIQTGATFVLPKVPATFPGKVADDTYTPPTTAGGSYGAPTTPPGPSTAPYAPGHQKY